MQRLVFTVLAILAVARPALAAETCGAAMHPPIDALGPLTAGRLAGGVELAAPAEAAPRGGPKSAAAWVARLHQGVIGGDGWLETAWLVPRRDCSGYVAEQRARVVVPAARYSAFAAAIEPFALPPRGAFSAEAQLRDELAGGGSGGEPLALRVTAPNWTVARALPHRSEEAARLLRLFAELAAGRPGGG